MNLQSNEPCAFLVVSPRDLWLCVLPRWQFNVNVNLQSNEPVPPTATLKNLLWFLGIHLISKDSPTECKMVEDRTIL